MEKLGMALEVIQEGMRQNTPISVKTSVGQAAEVLDRLFNSHMSNSKRGGNPEEAGMSPHLEENGDFHSFRFHY